MGAGNWFLTNDIEARTEMFYVEMPDFLEANSGDEIDAMIDHDFWLDYLYGVIEKSLSDSFEPLFESERHWGEDLYVIAENCVAIVATKELDGRVAVVICQKEPDSMDGGPWRGGGFIITTYSAEITC